MELERKAILDILGIRPDIENIDDSREAYDNFMLAENISSIVAKYKKELREKMFLIATEEVKPDKKGSYIIRFDDGSGFKKEARVSLSIDKDKAIELAGKKGLNILKDKLTHKRSLSKLEVTNLVKEYPDIFEIESKLDEGLLEQAYINEEITDEEFENIVNRKVNYALRKYKAKK